MKHFSFAQKMLKGYTKLQFGECGEQVVDDEKKRRRAEDQRTQPKALNCLSYASSYKTNMKA